jgi:hypothetical protein
MKDFGDLLAQQVDLRIHPAMLTAAALTALPKSERDDNMVVACRKTGGAFLVMWKADSITTADASTVYVPDDIAASPAYIGDPTTAPGRYHVLGTTGSALLASDARVAPNPTTAGKMLYDTGTAYAETAAGTAHQVLHGAAGSPTWGAVDLPTEVSGLLPGTNIDPSANSFAQVVQDAGTMTAGTVTYTAGSGVTIRAGAKILVTRNSPDTTAGHWGKLSIGTVTPGGVGVGSVVINSSNASDTSSVSLLILG